MEISGRAAPPLEWKGRVSAGEPQVDLRPVLRPSGRADGLMTSEGFSWCPCGWPWGEAGVVLGESRVRPSTWVGIRGPGLLKLQTPGAARKAVDAGTLSGSRGTMICLNLFIYIIYF